MLHKLHDAMIVDLDNLMLEIWPALLPNPFPHSSIKVSLAELVELFLDRWTLADPSDQPEVLEEWAGGGA